MSQEKKQVVLEVKNLSKVYEKGQSGEKIVVLDDVSFDLHEGEILGFIGANGAGKSTLLKLISEITAPTFGEIKYHGRLMSILEVGTGFHPDLTGRENIYLNGSILGFSNEEIDSAYGNILEFSGLSDYIEMPVKQYSSGMYLRLAFSIAFHFPVDILVVDEVLAVGDAEFQAKCYERIKQIVAHGVSILLVSHNTRQIVEYCHRCLLIESGKLVMTDFPQKVVEAYLEKTRPESKEVLENDRVKLLGITINDQKESAVFSLNESIHFKFHLEKRHSGTSMEIILLISDINGARVLMDGLNLRADYSPNIREEGILEVKTFIPSAMLNYGTYFVGVIFIENQQKVAIWEQVSKFKISSTKNDQHLSFLRHMVCSIKPHLHWEYENKG